jgi:hypothetical protein
MVLRRVVQILHHLRSSNVRHFGMIAATALKLQHRGDLQWHDLRTEFQKKYLPVTSEVDEGTDIQDSDLSLYFSFRKETALKAKKYVKV